MGDNFALFGHSGRRGRSGHGWQDADSGIGHAIVQCISDDEIRQVNEWATSEQGGNETKESATGQKVIEFVFEGHQIHYPTG